MRSKSSRCTIGASLPGVAEGASECGLYSHDECSEYEPSPVGRRGDVRAGPSQVQTRYALLTIVAGAVAVLAACDSETDSTPLTLTLSAPQICETAQPGGFREWWGVAEVPVTWTVAGGEAPYTLTIDGESEDAAAAYAGASGEASVSCALESGKTYIHVAGDTRSRRYRSQPVVDSALKTIHAQVTDSEGRTAGAAVGVYVVLSLVGTSQLLRSGQTYRLHDVLLTVPDGIYLAVDNLEDFVGSAQFVALIVLRDEYGSLADDSTWAGFIFFEKRAETLIELNRHVDPELADKLDELVASIGQPPAATPSD